MKIIPPHNFEFSIIVPVYNRADEVNELLDSLTQQTDKDFEVVIVEDGSAYPCRNVVDTYSKQLNIHYFDKQNSGPGQSRNYGSERAKGNYHIFFDSDCIIPAQYLEIVRNRLTLNPTDAYGGPDAAHAHFTPLQKAINYSMTSMLTTGGIRGKNESAGKFHPRSFNMGYSEAVFQKTGGFSKMRFGEDIDMSLRILKNGFSTALIKEAYVYHKRRSTLSQFFKQVYNSGLARINLYKRHPSSLKMVHFLPSAFVLSIIMLIILSTFKIEFFFLILFFCTIVFFDAFRQDKCVRIALLSIITTFTQLFGYGLGFMHAFWYRIVLGKDEYHQFEKTFYD